MNNEVTKMAALAIMVVNVAELNKNIVNGSISERFIFSVVLTIIIIDTNINNRILLSVLMIFPLNFIFLIGSFPSKVCTLPKGQI